MSSNELLSEPAGAEPSQADAARRPTLRDVARRAGVSMKTASRAVNGEPTVNPDLALRVSEAAVALHYRPNLTARSLRRSDRATQTIGVVLFDISNAFSATLARAIEDRAAERGIVVISTSVDEDPARERENALALASRQVDGLVVVPAGDDQSYLANEQRLGLKIVFVDRLPQLVRADAVVSDNRGGARRAIKHLLERGHQRVAFLGDREHVATMQERRRGYAEAFEDAGIALDARLTAIDLDSPAAIHEAVTSLMSHDPPTALFTAQNLNTIESVRVLRAMGLSRRVALVGFDDFETADLLDPGITVVSQDPRAMGMLGCELLLRRIDGDDSPFETHVLPVTLAARGSGEIPPASRD
jgi:LacI family transcriptional regulator